MKKYLILIVISLNMYGQALYFPPLTGTTWSTTSPASLGWNVPAIDSLYTFLDQNNSKAFIVLKDGKIVIEKYFGTFTQDSAWYWASAGKSLTSMLVGIAQQENLLSISDTASRWLGKGWTSLPSEKEGKITIRNQLTMTTGLDDGVADPYNTTKAQLQYKADAGTRWAYHNAPYTLLDSVIQKASGQSLNIFFQGKVKQKSGINGIFLRSGFNNVFYSTPRMMARYGLLILNKGMWDTTPVLTDTAYFNAMTTSSQSINPSYGYLWWLNGKTSYMIPQTQLVFPGSMSPNAPDDMIAALGKNGQFINVVPSMKLVFIRMGDAPDNSLVPFVLNDQIWQKLNIVLNNTVSAHEFHTTAVPGTFALFQNYPNPFNPVTMINYQLPMNTHVTLKIYDAIGRAVATLVNETKEAGKYSVQFNGSKLSSGIYSYRLHTDNFVQTKKMIILK